MLKVRGHSQRETKITEGRAVAGTGGTHLQVERLVLTDKAILTAGSMLLPLTPSANQPLAANFFPTLILAFNQMDIIPETQASTDKLSPMGQLVRGAPPMSCYFSLRCLGEVPTPWTSTSACQHAQPFLSRKEQGTVLHCKAHQHVFLGAAMKSNCTESSKWTKQPTKYVLSRYKKWLLLHCAFSQ